MTGTVAAVRLHEHGGPEDCRGGVGLIACQWASALGARVIGTVSTPAKADPARRNGCDLTLLLER